MTEALVKGGSVPALCKAIQLGAPITDWACISAASSGKLDVLKWLR